MKKIALIFCVLAIVLTMLVACETDLGHEHEFSADKWEMDMDYHWRPCVASDDCGEQGSKGAHEFEPVTAEDGTVIAACKVCGATDEILTNLENGTDGEDGSETTVTVLEHDHVYKEDLSADERYHWYGCQTEGCGAQKEKNGHAFGNPEVTYGDNQLTVKKVCVDCGYEKITKEEVKTEVDNAVSWDNAFKNFKLKNFTMDVYFKSPNYTHTNHCVVTDDRAFYSIPGSNEFYTFSNGDGTYTTYCMAYDINSYVKMEDTSNSYLIGAQTETVIQVSFESNFDKFTYDEATASYVSKETIACEFYHFDGTPYGETLYCYDSTVKLTNGTISSIEAKYYIGEPNPEGYEQYFKYYNIGITALEIPQEVIDGSILESEYTGNRDETENGPAPEQNVVVTEKGDPEEGVAPEYGKPDENGGAPEHEHPNDNGPDHEETKAEIKDENMDGIIDENEMNGVRDPSINNPSNDGDDPEAPFDVMTTVPVPDHVVNPEDGKDAVVEEELKEIPAEGYNPNGDRVAQSDKNGFETKTNDEIVSENNKIVESFR